jgi:uncharacterized delta-60 repeat protein
MTHTLATEGQRGRGSARLLAWGLCQGGLGILVGLLLLPVGVMAQEAGDLDVTFDSDGKVITDIMGTVFAVALQPDGKIVVAGAINDPNDASTGNADFGLARFLSDGTPDLTFGGDGHIRTDLGSYEQARAVLLQPDGKIVAVGSAADPFDPPADVPSGIAMARYLSNGTLDTTFGGGDGIVIGGMEGAWAAVLEPDGKIVVAMGGALARYLSNGTLDTTFGGGGLVTIDFVGFFAYAVALQPDGKIVVAGHAQVFFGDQDFALARYNSNGTLDTTFSGGQVATDFGQTQDRATGIALQPDGKIVAAGFAESPLHRGFALARYNSNGTLDATFSSDGRVTTDFGSTGGISVAYLNGVALQPDGKVVGAGFTDPSPGERQFALARYRSDGTLDTTFGVDGRVTTDIGDGDTDIAWAILLQPDGKIVAAGQANTISDDGGDFALVRYESGLVPGVGPPTNKEECKDDGWRTFNLPRAFKNQGDCIQFVNTGK